MMSALFALPAAAQDNVERARPHFEAAQGYYTDGEYASALREFRRAYELTEHHEILYNIARCYERLGELASAVEALDQYLANEAEVAERSEAEALRERLRRTIEQRAELTEPEPPRPPPPPARSEPLPIPAIAVFSIAGAALIAGAILGGVALAEHDRLAAECGVLPEGCTDAQIAGLNGLTIGADVSFGVSLAAAGVAIVLLIVAPGNERARVRVGPGSVVWNFD